MRHRSVMKRQRAEVLAYTERFAGERGLSLEAICTFSKKRTIVEMRRQLFWELCVGRPYPVHFVATVLGFDHSTVMHHVRLRAVRVGIESRSLMEIRRQWRKMRTKP